MSTTQIKGLRQRKINIVRNAKKLKTIYHILHKSYISYFTIPQCVQLMFNDCTLQIISKTIYKGNTKQFIVSFS